ncbi:glycosyltransferase family 2 protein [Paenibacillus validus]|uniref:glycosyltransferase family 2 protein n=1 Tax=Paenibacillus validus TaxID=44253 RepID=UPI000FD88A3A|nr:glycosyltransferase family 2 protein [Paenibacillus validus]MED4600756.1 glycosyltransferase family 2 protein [Paenibacillus validus]MED4606173.1 glycosyltransferase family 2 protein [Paenibacillus validus]
MENLVSIITPVYNSEKYIGETIKSVLAQTHNNWEMLIVDDCSKDNTAEVINGFNDPRIKYYKLEENSGAAVARNRALENAKGKYIAFLDADDMWKPNKIEKQLNFMIENKAGFSFTGYEILKENGNKVIKVPSKLNYSQFMKNTIIGTLTVMVNTDIVGEVRLVNVKKDHDSMTWAKLLREGYLAYGLNESLAYYRKVEGSISNDKFKAAKNHWNNCRNLEKLSLPRCLYYFFFYGINAVKKHYL